MTVTEFLNWGTRRLDENRVENPRMNAELLLAHSLGLSREGLYIRLKDELTEEAGLRFKELVRRRLSGEPLQYILGKQQFWSIDLRVDPRVLIPRPDTEILVAQAVSILSAMSCSAPPFVLEIGTGSGAVAISVRKEVKRIRMVATDLSRDALLVARENAKGAGLLGEIQFLCGDLFSPFRRSESGLFDMILSNPPYISLTEIEKLSTEVRDHEPRVALNGGADGLDFYRAMAIQAPCYLRTGGWLLVEMGQGQGVGIKNLLEERGGFSEPEFVRDLSGMERVLKAQRK
jgi:release factor glutamine methyltransferase